MQVIECLKEINGKNGKFTLKKVSFGGVKGNYLLLVINQSVGPNYLAIYLRSKENDLYLFHNVIC